MSEVRIPLSQGMFAIVDASDAELVSAYRWTAVKSRGTYYARRRAAVGDGTYKAQYMHSLLSGFPITDHRNGDGLDNRRENLRSARHADNMHNQRISRRNSSGFKGVSWHAHGKKFRATIKGPKGQVALGYYANPKDAALAYDRAARDLYGEFAALNFPRQGEVSARRDS